jgi:hypothetical protein
MRFSTYPAFGPAGTGGSALLDAAAVPWQDACSA